MPWKKKRTNTVKSVSVARIVRPMIKRALREDVETKLFDLANNNLGPIDYSGTVVALADIAQGDDINNRIGRKVQCKRLYLRIAIKAPTWSAGNYAQFRLIVFQDTMNTGTDPTTADVLETVGSASSVLSPLDRQFAEANRFHILYDQVKHLNYNDSMVELFKVNKTKLRPIEFVGSSATSNGKNMIYALVITDQPPSVGFPVNYDTYSRLYFTDS